MQEQEGKDLQVVSEKREWICDVYPSIKLEIISFMIETWPAWKSMIKMKICISINFYTPHMEHFPHKNTLFRARYVACILEKLKFNHFTCDESIKRELFLLTTICAIISRIKVCMPSEIPQIIVGESSYRFNYWIFWATEARRSMLWKEWNDSKKILKPRGFRIVGIFSKAQGNFSCNLIRARTPCSCEPYIYDEANSEC